MTEKQIIPYTGHLKLIKVFKNEELEEGWELVLYPVIGFEVEVDTSFCFTEFQQPLVGNLLTFEPIEHYFVYDPKTSQWYDPYNFEGTGLKSFLKYYLSHYEKPRPEPG